VTIRDHNKYKFAQAEDVGQWLVALQQAVKDHAGDRQLVIMVHPWQPHSDGPASPVEELAEAVDAEGGDWDALEASIAFEPVFE